MNQSFFQWAQCPNTKENGESPSFPTKTIDMSQSDLDQPLKANDGFYHKENLSVK